MRSIGLDVGHHLGARRLELRAAAGKAVLDDELREGLGHHRPGVVEAGELWRPPRGRRRWSRARCGRPSSRGRPPTPRCGCRARDRAALRSAPRSSASSRRCDGRLSQLITANGIEVALEAPRQRLDDDAGRAPRLHRVVEVVDDIGVLLVELAGRGIVAIALLGHRQRDDADVLVRHLLEQPLEVRGRIDDLEDGAEDAGARALVAAERQRVEAALRVERFLGVGAAQAGADDAPVAGRRRAGRRCSAPCARGGRRRCRDGRCRGAPCSARRRAVSCRARPVAGFRGSVGASAPPGTQLATLAAVAPSRQARHNATCVRRRGPRDALRQRRGMHDRNVGRRRRAIPPRLRRRHLQHVLVRARAVPRRTGRSTTSPRSATTSIRNRCATFMEKNGIGTGHIRTVAGRRPGLYLIHQAGGDRHFTYWRDMSAARTLGDDPEALSAGVRGRRHRLFLRHHPRDPHAAAARPADEGDRQRAQRRGAGRVRPQRPPGALEQQGGDGLDHHRRRHHRRHRAAHAHRRGAAVRRRHRQRRRRTAISASGSRRWRSRTGRRWRWSATATRRYMVKPQGSPKVVDPTGAGDSFNGAYLAARVQGKAPDEAARAAHRVAGIVIGHKGALVDPALVKPARPARSSFS